MDAESQARESELKRLTLTVIGSIKDCWWGRWDSQKLQICLLAVVFASKRKRRSLEPTIYGYLHPCPRSNVTSSCYSQLTHSFFGTLEPVALPFQVESDLLGYDPTELCKISAF